MLCSSKTYIPLRVWYKKDLKFHGKNDFVPCTHLQTSARKERLKILKWKVVKVENCLDNLLMLIHLKGNQPKSAQMKVELVKK
jgi:hypothetical protein